MPMMRALSALACLALLASPAGADVDLTKIDRSIRNEPVYESKDPQYCLLVFGPEAKVRVWVVLDGDALYVDRNGNGDLTDPGERMPPQYAHQRPEKRPDVEIMRNFMFRRPDKFPWETDSEPILSCLPEVYWFFVSQQIPRDDWSDHAWVERLRKKPFRVALASTTTKGWEQDASLAFAKRPQDAPILHFAGPLTVVVSRGGFAPLEFRRGETVDLFAELTTPGFGADVRMRTDNNLPTQAHPVADVEFPAARPSDAPIRYHVELTEPC